MPVMASMRSCALQLYGLYLQAHAVDVANWHRKQDALAILVHMRCRQNRVENFRLLFLGHNDDYNFL